MPTIALIADASSSNGKALLELLPQIAGHLDNLNKICQRAGEMPEGFLVSSYLHFNAGPSQHLTHFPCELWPCRS